MKKLAGLSIRHGNGCLELLDQELLPHREEWVAVNSPEQMITCIKALKVRGAPLIGVAAALCLGKYAEQGATQEQFIQAAFNLKQSRPTAVNLMESVDRLLKLTDPYQVESIVAKAQEIFDEDVELCKKIGRHGAALIADGDGILTHCNTGGLATAGRGTALGIIQTAHEQGKKIHVFVDETRPLLQGARLTTWELEKLSIPHTLICDNMAAALMTSGKIDKVLVGADRIAHNGDFANKIGTYGLAVNARYHKIPFYVAAPYTTIDQSCSTGSEIPIEQRAAQEVRRQWAPEQCQVDNPAFDITPHELVNAWILDQGAIESF